MDLVQIGLALTWVVVALGYWLGYQVVRQNGRLLLRLERLEDQLSRLSPSPSASPPDGPSGLAIGTIAPRFTLSDLQGTHVSLDQFRGRPLLLVFFNPTCGFCLQLMPRLAELPAEPEDGRPRVL